MSKKVVSVVIPTYNKKDRLLLALESFNNQTGDMQKFEVIVIDDGSTDNTTEAVENFKSNYKLIYIKQENAGRSVARNAGVRKAKGSLIIFTDDDLIVSREFISSHVAGHSMGKNIVLHGRIFNLPYLKFFRNPTTGEVYENTEAEGAELEYVRKFLISKDELLTMEKINKQKKLTYFEKIVHSTFVQDIKELQWLCFTGGNVSCPKSVLEDIGMFDENFGKKWGCEDLEVGYRIFLKGIDFSYSMEACNYHMAHARMTYREELKGSVDKFYLKHSNLYIKKLDKLLLGEIKDIHEYINCIHQ